MTRESLRGLIHLKTAPTQGTEAGRLSTAFGATDLLLLLMTLIWGSNFIAIKYSLVDLRPLAFNGLRFTIASITLLIATLAIGENLKVPRADAWRLLGLGILANAIYQSLFITGLAHTRTGNAALILSTTPLFTAVISRLRRQEYFTTRGVTGLLLAFAGIVLIILSGRSAVGFGTTIYGDCLLIVSTLCWSLYTVGAKPMVNKHGAMKATTLMMLTGTPVFLLVCARALISQDWAMIRPVAWAGLIYSALLAIALAHFIWNYGVRKIGSTRTALYSNITPIIAMLIAWPALGEVPAVGQLLGAVIIFVGLYFVRSGMYAVQPEIARVEELEEVSLTPGKH
ncbi:MAG TPA: EamA family transporter [Blastocatellia bacterium]|jgi:drug/metabolite transporter (DMT)-like permease|nr:EamA family transporter [Blastocatellia bacterium]